MPKFGIHKIVLDEVTQKLRDAGGSSADLARIIEENRFSAYLGAIGPDMFFFAPDYPIVETLFPVYDFLSSIYAFYKKEVEEPIEALEDHLKDVRDQTLEAIGGNVITDILDHLDLIERQVEELKPRAITAGLLLGINPLEATTGSNGLAQNPFAKMVRELYDNVLKPPLQNNYEEQDWYWFDMLHYRNTGDFVRNLVQAAGDSPQRQAYAMGYLTHYATDFLGHPYVNQIVGGPFRLGVQRHVTVENFMDAFEYFNRADQPRIISQTLYQDLGFDKVATLPDDLATLLRDGMRQTYTGKLHPLRVGKMGADPCRPDPELGMLSQAQIKEAYRLLRTALAVMGGEDDLRPKEPFEGASEVLADLMSAINSLNPPPPPPDLLPTMDPTALFSSSFSMQGLIDALALAGRTLESWFDEWMGYLAETAQYCLDTVVALIRILRALIALAGYVTGGVVLAALYGIELGLDQLIRVCRKIMALNGFGYPDPEDINDGISRSLMFIFDSQVHFIHPASKQSYPRLREQGQAHLSPPQYEDECFPTLPGFHAGTFDQPVKPDSFIRNESFDQRVLEAYAQAATPADTQALRQDGRQIGNAVDFSQFLIENAFNPTPSVPQQVLFANWNLDCDRGYAAKSWTALLPHNSDPSALGKLCFTRLNPDMTIDINHMLDRPEHRPLILQGIADEGQGRCRANSDDFTLYEFKAKNEVYDNQRMVGEIKVANLKYSEANIDDRFMSIATRDPREWQCILSDRLRVSGNTWRENIYHVNGILTPAYDAFYEAFHIEHYFRTGPSDPIQVRLLYNWSADWWPFKLPTALRENLRLVIQRNILTGDVDIKSPVDMVQAVMDKGWSYLCIQQVLGEATFSKLAAGDTSINTTAPGNIPPLNYFFFENPTTVAVIALLYDALAQAMPIGFVGYSQGTQIVFNGILGFAFQGPAERQFLQDMVKVFFIAPMIDLDSRRTLVRLINAFASIQNPGDLVPDIAGNVLPTMPDDLTVLLDPDRVASFFAALADEKHQAYLNFPRIRTDSPNHQNFF